MGGRRHKVLHEPPPHPLSLNKSLDPDLSIVCLKCLNKEPSARYESAQGLAEELERWLRGEPIEARPTRLFERAWRWAWREPKLAALSIGLLLLLGTVTILSLTLYEREKARLDKADREKVYLIANLKPRLKREWDKEGLVQLNAKELASFMKQEFPEEYHELVVGITAPSSDADPINLVPKHVPFLNVVQAARPQSSAQLVFGLYLYKTQAAAIAGINEHSLDIIRLAADDYAILSEQDMSLELTPLVLEDPTNAGVIFVRADSGISEARDLKGKTLLLGNPESCLGHLWPKAALAENGLRWSDFKCITNALSGNVISMVHRSRTFPADDFKEVSAFAEKLCSPADSLSADIASQLDKEAREELDLYRSKRKASLKMAPLLAANLNRIVNGPSIWDPALFAGVKLRPETLELCDRNPTGTDACRLNRLLLEDAYPRELARREEYDAGVAESAELKEFGAQFKIITEFNYPGYVWLATDRLKSNPTLFEAVRQRLLHAKSSGDFREFAPAELNGLRERLRHARSFDFAISVKSGAEAN